MNESHGAAHKLDRDYCTDCWKGSPVCMCHLVSNQGISVLSKVVMAARWQDTATNMLQISKWAWCCRCSALSVGIRRQVISLSQ